MFVLNLIAFIGLVKLATGQLGLDESKLHSFEHVVVNSNGVASRGRHLRLSNGTTAEKKLAQTWYSWNYCTSAFITKSFTPMNRLVPKNTIFLTGYPTFKIDNSSLTCKANTISRAGTIGTGTQTVFFPLVSVAQTDYDDDYLLMNCTKFPNETLPNRLAAGEVDNVKFTKTSFKEQL
jgi:hypothetical protein